MADVKSSEVSKLTLSTFQPKRIGGEDSSVTSVVLGYLFGRGTGIVEAKAPDGAEIFYGMSGDFEARIISTRDQDPNNLIVTEVIRSGKAFISSPFGDRFINALSDKTDEKTGEVIEQGASAVEFAYSVGVRRAGNPNGYEWFLTPLIEMKAENDPLAALKRLAPSNISGLAQLEAPKAEGKKA